MPPACFSSACVPPSVLDVRDCFFPYFDCAPSCDDGAALECASGNHQSVVEGAFCFVKELRSASAEKKSGALCRCALTKDVVSLATDLLLFEDTACP